MSEAQWNLEGQENKDAQVEIPEVLPLLPIRDIVIYPYMMLPLFVGLNIVLVWAALAWQPLRELLHTDPIGPSEWLVCVAAAAAVAVVARVLGGDDGRQFRAEQAVRH